MADKKIFQCKMAGRINGKMFQVGDPIELPPEEAIALIKAGFIEAGESIPNEIIPSELALIIGGLNTRLDEMFSINEALKKAIENLKVENDEMNKINETLRNDINTLKVKNDELSAINETLASEKSALKVENDELKVVPKKKSSKEAQ